MTKKQEDGNTPRTISRRDAFAAAGVCFAMLSQKALAAMTTGPASTAPKAAFTKDSEANGMVEVTGIHEGKGKGKIKFFRFDGAPAPAHFIIYDLPPGASEGVHVHFLDNRNEEGSFDEYYYFISGQGQMEIDGEIVAVAKGDHVHTPLEVAHGVEIPIPPRTCASSSPSSGAAPRLPECEALRPNNLRRRSRLLTKVVSSILAIRLKSYSWV